MGEVLWDVIDEMEHLGGAPFNFAAHARKLGHQVLFISAVGADERGKRVLDRMTGMGLSTRYVRKIENQATGIVKVTLDPGGQPQFVIHRPAAYDAPELSPAQLEELLSPPPDWIYFGTLLQMSPQARELTMRLLDSKSGARRFYDVNLRVNCHTPSLVRELMSRATVAKLNEQEAAALDRMFGKTHRSLEEFCRDYAREYGWETVCVTRGAEGCALMVGDKFVESPGYHVKVADAVGAGDAFAAALVHGLGSGWSARVIADFSNRVGALVASRRGAIPSWTVEEARALSG